MSNNGNSSSTNGIKNIINEIVKNENPAENEIGNVSIQGSNNEIKAPSSLNDNNQGNNQEVHNQAPVQNQNIQNNNKKNNGNHNKEKQSISVAYGEKIDNMNKKMDKMGSDISKIKEDITGIKTGINNTNTNITGLRTEVGKGLNNLAFTNYLIALMLFLLISIIVYQIKNSN